ncbi:MAG: hypothetical protein E7004_06060 [Alphaproteobacteria bacterium]|nr:hypothetical protein [Alphaproteobacteria bacterium]
MTKTPVNNYIDAIQRQIADIAVKIKQKRQKEFQDFGDDVFELKIKSPAVQNQAYKLVDDKVAYSILGQNAPADSNYVAETYDTVSKADKKTTVIEGLDFKNNKEYDFKV